MEKRSKQEEKPDQILKLEQELGVQLTHFDNFNLKYILTDSGIAGDFFHPENCQYSEVNGDVIALSLDGLELHDLSFLCDFMELKYLSLLHCNITDVHQISHLSLLEVLYLGGNKIADPKPISKLLELQILAVWNNPIKDLGFLVPLKQLKYLFAQSASVSDLSSLLGLSQLKEVSFRGNRIKEIPYVISEQFDYLLLRNNEDSDRYVKHIDVQYNPLEFPPSSVVDLGSEIIKNYYNVAEEYGDQPLSEGRVIVVGDGSAGKSSLIEKILYGEFEEGKDQTNGINIEDWEVIYNERDLKFHFWDFGGQEIQHAVHKFFFTSGCLYVLVLDNRKEEEPEYWLQQIESLGGGAPVLVVFNKADQNASEIADRKFLKEKYPNIVGFYKTSCKSGQGIEEFKAELEKEAVKLRTVHERLPNNWLAIKRELETLTSGDQYYLTFEVYQEICGKNHAEREEIQKLLLTYFTTIGVVTWFGDTYLNFMHVLSPAWITQGVYKIITAKKTARLYGQIEIGDFKELLYPENKDDYTYDENHYGYLLSMMKKFDLCYTADDRHILIPSAFGKEPKVEYSDFKGENVRTYILQFSDYMPFAIIHRFIAKNIASAYDNNYWYSGIVVEDSKSSALAMVHADKEDKRIYVRIKGESPLGQWEHIRRELGELAESYANVEYSELVELEESATVDYEDLLSHLQVGKSDYFHPRLKRDFNVGYLMGLFENKEQTIEKHKSGEISLVDIRHDFPERGARIPQTVIQILNNNSSQVSSNIHNQIQVDIDIDIDLVNEYSSEVQSGANYLLEELKESNEELKQALIRVVEFSELASHANKKSDVKKKGWGRKLKKVVEVLKSARDHVKHIDEGKEALTEVLEGIKNLAGQFDLSEAAGLLTSI